MRKKFVSLVDYTFALGKIRSLERFLIRDKVFEEAVISDLPGALRLFVEAGHYDESLLHISNSQDLEDFLSQQIVQLKKMMQGLILDDLLLELLDLTDLKKIKQITQDYPSQFLKDYFNYLIDLHNIKTFLRFYILKEPQEQLKTYLVCEGFIRIEDLLKLYLQDLNIFIRRLEYVYKDNTIVDYALYLKEAIQILEQKGSFIALEKAIQNFLIQKLKFAKYMSFGPEPVLAYYFAKLNEFNLMRMIILAKLNDISVDLIKERLNLSYA